MRGRKLASDTRILCASPKYLSEHGTPLNPSDLDDHNVIVFGNTRPQRLVHDDGSEFVFSPEDANCRLIIDDGHSLRLATKAGAGVSANSLWSVRADLQSGALIRVLPDWTVEDDSVLWLMYPQTNVLSVKVRVFMDFLLDRIGKQPPWLEGR